MRRADELSLKKGRLVENNASTSFAEEPMGVMKSGFVTAGYAPVKAKKLFFAVLSERALELHENEKSWKKKKTPRHLFDLAYTFNVHNDHFDAKLKRCICLMGPEETLLIKSDDSGWFDALMAAVIPARAVKYGRPVFAAEFFECAWDVRIDPAPKLKRQAGTEQWENVCLRKPCLAGPRRLCFYAHTVVLCQVKIEPAERPELAPPSMIPPFRIEDFEELPRKFIASFGCQERYFLMRMGRGSPLGACEVWALCESEDVARDVHDKMNTIIEREAEKKKKMNIDPLCIPQPVLPKVRGHRDRAHTHHGRERTPRESGLHGRRSPGGSTTGSLSGSTGLVHSARPSVSMPIKEESRGSAAEETEDSGGTLKVEDTSAYAPMSHAEWRHSSAGQLPGTYQLEGVKSYFSGNCSEDSRSTDSCYSSFTDKEKQPQPRAYSFGEPHAPSKPSSSARAGLSLATTPSSSGTTDRSMAAGGASPSEPEAAHSDPRKRAFSLGSKHFFFQRPFRKFSRQQRNSQTSGGSLASAESATALTQQPAPGEERGRSGSFGSGRSTPRRSGASGAGANSNPADHLVEIDFGAGGSSSGRCGSVVSVDSPARSRTSSFGTSLYASGVASTDGDGLRPSQQYLLKARIQKTENDEYVLASSSDWVPTNTSVPQSSTSNSLNEDYVMPKGMDSRDSQCFETIEETGSIKSSSSGSPAVAANDDDYTVMDARATRHVDLSVIPEFDHPPMVPISEVSPNPDSPQPSIMLATIQVHDPPREKEKTASAAPQTPPVAVEAPLLPKGSSVPSLLRDHTEQLNSLNYVDLQIPTNSAAPSTHSESSRVRSKSGVANSRTPLETGPAVVVLSATVTPKKSTDAEEDKGSSEGIEYVQLKPR